MNYINYIFFLINKYLKKYIIQIQIHLIHYITILITIRQIDYVKLTVIGDRVFCQHGIAIISK